MRQPWSWRVSSLQHAGRVESCVQDQHESLIEIERYPRLHAAVEVHSVDTDSRIILDSQINVFAYAEAEVACLGEVPLFQLVLPNLETTLEDFFGLGASDSDMDGNLLVTADTFRITKLASQVEWKRIFFSILPNVLTV